MKALIKKTLGIISFILLIFSLSSCDIKFSIETKNTTIEQTKSQFIERMNQGLYVTIDNKKMEFNVAKAYIDSNYNGNNYTEKMNSLITQLEQVNNDFYVLYSNYVKTINTDMKTKNTDFYSYKSNNLNSYISENTIDGIISLVEKLDKDEEINALLPQINADSTKALQNSNFSCVNKINVSKANIAAYLNSFANQFKELPYMSNTAKENISTFLDAYDITVEDTNTIDYDGYTTFTNGTPTGLSLKYDESTLKLIGVLSHELGHVSDNSLSNLENDEAYACVTEALTYYSADTFSYNLSLIPTINTYYKQRVLYDIINSFYGWVGYLSFIKQIYTNSTLSYENIIDYMDNTYSSVSYSYPTEYSLLWKTMWIYYAYYDLSNSGSFVYTYGSVNSAYIWNLYKTDQSSAILKYQNLMTYDGSFKDFDQIGLIGENNLQEAYTSLKNIILEDIVLYKTLKLIL